MKKKKGTWSLFCDSSVSTDNFCLASLSSDAHDPACNLVQVPVPGLILCVAMVCYNSLIVYLLLDI